MESNLYGISSINLDKIRGRTIKNRILIALAVICIANIVFTFIPKRLQEHILGLSEVIGTGDDEILRFRKTFLLSAKNLNTFEILASELKAQEFNTTKSEGLTETGILPKVMFNHNHQIEMNIRWFETSNEQTRNKFLGNMSMSEEQIMELGYTEMKDIKYLKNETIENGQLFKSLGKGRQCNFQDEQNQTRKFKCSDLLISSDSIMKQKPYQLVQIDVKRNQTGIEFNAKSYFYIESLQFSMVHYNQSFAEWYGLFKMIFVVFSVFTLVNFQKRLNQFSGSDCGVVQRYIRYLLIALIFFNDPFYMIGRGHLWYQILQASCESAFISLLLFFWLLLVHSIACQDNVVTIDPKRFWYPKVIISSVLFGYLMIMRFYIYVQYSQDPFFDLIEERHLTVFYAALHSFGIIQVIVYAIYFVILLLRAVKTIQILKKTYKYSIGVTVVAVAASSAMILENGQASQRLDPSKFVIFYTFVNLYVWLISFFYAPYVEIGSSSGRYNVASAERERDQIMKEFYEHELEDQKEADQSFDTSAGDVTERKLLPQEDEGITISKRGIKKAPREKLKAKLWDQIVNQAEEEAQSDSSDDIEKI